MLNRLMLAGTLVALGLSLGTAKAATDEVLARTDGDLIGRFHFAGTTRMLADANAAKLKELAAMPETANLREITLQKLSTAPFRLLQQKLAKGNLNTYHELIHPLLEDLLSEESYAEMRGPSNAVPELMLAVHLNNARAKVWHDNLSKIIASWTTMPVKEIKGDGYTGWELKKHHDPNVIRCLRAGEWVLFGWGQDEIRLQAGFLQRIKDKKRPVEAFKGDWLDVLVDWPTVMRYHPFTLPAPLPAKLPKMHLTVQTQKDYLRPKLTMQFPESLNLNLEPWRIPTNLIHNPIVSFAAARGVGPWLGQLETVKKAQISSVPNQITFWSMANVPFESSAAAPVAGASNYLAQIAPNLIAVLNPELSKLPTATTAIWTNQQLLIRNIPFVSPYLSAIHDRAGDFLMAGLFPPRNTSMIETNKQRGLNRSFPPELLHEVMSKPNLVYYGWEINQERIAQWESLNQVNLLLKGEPLPPASSAGVKWLMAAKSKLGNCGTEITLTAPNELTLLRNGSIGFTGLELTALEYWLDAPEFPLHARYPHILRPGIFSQPGSR